MLGIYTRVMREEDHAGHTPPGLMGRGPCWAYTTRVCWEGSCWAYTTRVCWEGGYLVYHPPYPGGHTTPVYIA